MRGPMIDAGDANCGKTLTVPCGSPFCRNEIRPVSVRTCHTVAALVTFERSNARFSCLLPLSLKFFPSLKSNVVSGSSRRLLRGSALIVALPVSVNGTLIVRLYGVPLCERRFAANTTSCWNRYVPVSLN